MLFGIRKTAVFIILLASCSVMCAPLVNAQTLREALVDTYEKNPTLSKARAQLAGAVVGVSIAESGFLPSVTASASYGRSQSPLMSGHTTLGALEFKVTQNLFSGFQTVNSVAAAQAQVMAQRELLLNEEQNQLANAVAAYSNVYTALKIVKLRQQNLSALEEEVRADKARLNVGVGTKIDVAQSEAARAGALSQLSEAKADLTAAQASYLQIVGGEASNLCRPVLASDLPASLKDAILIGQEEHPIILSAKYMLRASGYNVKIQAGAMLPQLNLSASTDYNKIYHGMGKDGHSNSVGVSVSMPLFTGGRNVALVHQSQEKLQEAKLQLQIYEDHVAAALASAWAKFYGLKSAVGAYDESVRAAQVALNGVLDQKRVGQATTLDVLNSRSNLINAQISLAKAQGDLVVASYNIRAGMGRLTALTLALPVH